jgi:hypothetical protein
MKYEESYIQKTFVNWMRNKHPEIIFTSAPAVAKSARQGKENKLMGYYKGFPDLVIMLPKKGYNGILIEFKTPKGKIAPEQIECHEKLIALGYKVIICRSPEEAISTMEAYIR